MVRVGNCFIIMSGNIMKITYIFKLDTFKKMSEERYFNNKYMFIIKQIIQLHYMQQQGGQELNILMIDRINDMPYKQIQNFCCVFIHLYCCLELNIFDMS